MVDTISGLEWGANLVTTVSIGLAACNSPHTWSTGILGCALFGLLFFDNQLYADASLQLFFIATCLVGSRQWRRGLGGSARAVTRAAPRQLAVLAAAALAVTLGYGGLLHRFTDAYMPFVDAGVLALSIVAQLLLMQRQLETWPVWLAVNLISAPLFASRGLGLTAALYAAYALNAGYGWWRWHGELGAGAPAAAR